MASETSFDHCSGRRVIEIEDDVALGFIARDDRGVDVW